MRKYQFNWGLLGNIEDGRPNLGSTTRVEVYRLMQFTFRDVLEKQYGTEVADRIFYEAGKTAGVAFYEHMLEPVETFDEFVRKLQEVLKDMAIGVFRIEKSDLEKGEFVITVSEDLDCSGLPDFDYEICRYDEGFIASILEKWSGRPYSVKEIDCWCTGDRTCRFMALPEI
ncbi:MAG: V4R domain-containing protein [Vulcanimicrobiota bacterium]